MKIRKLVRDKIPKIIRADGKIPITHIASAPEFRKALLEKLKEEVKEFMQERNTSELVDILEVVYACGLELNTSPKKLELLRKEKVTKRGSFTKRIILDKVGEKNNS